MREWSVESYIRDDQRDLVMRCGNGCCTVGVSAAELEDFIVEVGLVCSELGYFDAKDVLQFIIRSIREKTPS